MKTLSFATFSFYGVNIQFKSNDEGLVGDIQKDFSFFSAPITDVQIAISACHEVPPYQTLPSMCASYLSPRNVCYYHDRIKYIDYAGKGLAIYDGQKSICDIYSAHYDLLYEASYMAILSLVNEKLEKRRIHRVHALGLATGGKAILVLLEMGGGKTTLALSLLSSSEKIRLISEDSPLIDPKGRILPFPIRIGVRPGEVPPEVPQEHTRCFKREEFGPKTLIDIDYFKNKICKEPCLPKMIVIGKRVLGRLPEIRPVIKYEAVKEFVKNSVIGLGLYQGIEYILQKGPWEILKKIPLGISRLNNALKVINKSETFVFYLGPDKEKNNLVLIDFLKKCEK